MLQMNLYREVVLILTQEFCLLYLRFLIVFLLSVWDIGYLFLLWFVNEERFVYTHPMGCLCINWYRYIKLINQKLFVVLYKFVEVMKMITSWCSTRSDPAFNFLSLTLKPVGCIFCMCSGVFYRTDIFNDHDLCQTIWG